MKNFFIAGIIIVTFITSCKKTDTTTLPKCDTVTTKAADSEIVYLDNWISTNGIDATKDERGFYYKIDSIGNEIKPSVCSAISVNYKAYTFDGYFVDKGDKAAFYLNTVIVGWKEALPLIGEGGRITMYLPPSLAYGVGGKAPKVAGNEYLIYEIELIDTN